MATRPIWKGYLKLSLVTCSVELYSATVSSEKVSFRVLNRTTGNPVVRQYLDSETGKVVDDKHQIKGYEIESNQFLHFEEAEIDALQIESSHTLNLDSFVNKGDIQQVYLDTPYFLAPADKVSTEAFAVIREALSHKKMAALARLVLYRRERPVVIEPFHNGMILTTLRYGHSVRTDENIFHDIEAVKIDPDMTELATHIIDKKLGKFDPDTFVDRYDEALLDLIKSRQKGAPVPKPVAPRKAENVINLFDALKKSLAATPSSEPRSTHESPASRRKKQAR